MSKYQRLVAPRVQRPRLLQRVRLESLRFGIAAGHRETETERLRREHLRMTVANPRRDFEPLAHVAEALIDGAGVNLAMPHHDAVRRRDAREAVGVAESNAVGEMAQRGRHAAVHILRVGKPAERPRLPFRRVDSPRRVEGALVLASARLQLAASEMEAAAKVVNFCERAIIEVGGGQRFGLSEGGERRRPAGL